MLKINNIKYRYDKLVYEFNLEANCSEIVGIIGQSGSGKSTFLDIFAGFLSPNDGEILFNNKNLLTLDTQNRPITILFQKYNLFEHLSVMQNVLLGVVNMNNDKNQDLKNAKEMLNELGLKSYENKQVLQLSGGEQQRVAIARALLRNKPILLLDEPFTGLDIQTKTQILKLVQKIAIKNNLIVIMVTHDMEDCNLIANKVYKIEEGKMHLYK